MADPVCGASIHATRLEAAVWTRLQELATEPKRVLSDFIQQQAAMAMHHARAHDMVAAAEAMVTQHKQALARLDADHALQRISDERHSMATAVVEAELKQAEADLEACRADILADEYGNVLETPDDWQRVVALVAQQHGQEAAESLVEHALCSGLSAIIASDLDALTPEEKRARVRQMLDRVVVDEHGAYMVLRLTDEKVTLCQEQQTVRDPDQQADGEQGAAQAAVPQDA
jgi:hypothetical protein